jgi:hypothetical protein
MKISLPEFIAELGDDEISSRMRTPVRTVQSWRRRERRPRPAQAEELIRISEGRLNFDSIYGPANTASS